MAENQKIENGPSESQMTSTKPASISEPGGTPINQAAESAVPIRKAIPVEPQHPAAARPVEIRRALPVKPLDQEKEDGTLLKSAEPSPSDLDE
jgi:hypothetical protein